MNTSHIPVLLEQAVEHLNITPGGVYVDATFGGGGHTKAILQQAGPKSDVIAIDLNPKAGEIADSLGQQARDQNWARFHFRQDNFANLDQIVSQLGFEQIDGILFDIGLSSDLLASDKGFSIRDTSPLDMRFSGAEGLSASDFINYGDEEDLVTIFSSFGQAPYSKSIARAIVNQRKKLPVSTAVQLTDLIDQTVPKHSFKKHPAIQIFQALRIATNQEFQNLSKAILASIELARPGARVVVISFHSLEDRIVKNIFKRMSGQCVCFKAPELCKCQKEDKLRILTKKPIIPDEKEIRNNPRSRSAKMRVAQRI